jgi:hypothetical protein
VFRAGQWEFLLNAGVHLKLPEEWCSSFELYHMEFVLFSSTLYEVSMVPSDGMISQQTQILGTAFMDNITNTLTSSHIKAI